MLYKYGCSQVYHRRRDGIMTVKMRHPRPDLWARWSVPGDVSGGPKSNSFLIPHGHDGWRVYMASGDRRKVRGGVLVSVIHDRARHPRSIARHGPSDELTGFPNTTFWLSYQRCPTSALLCPYFVVNVVSQPFNRRNHVENLMRAQNSIQDWLKTYSRMRNVSSWELIVFFVWILGN